VIGHLHGTELLMLERIAGGAPASWRYADRWASRMRAWAGRCRRLIVPPTGVERAARILELPPWRFEPLPSGVDVGLFAPRPVDRRTFWREVLAEDPRGWLPGAAPGSARYSAQEAAHVAHSVVILYVGRFTAVKRLDLLIGAFGRARARTAGPRASLVLVGGHPGEIEGEHPAEFAERLGVPDVYLAGWYGHDELPRFFAAADAVALVSDREQFGLALVEGMACGLPAIATASPGPASIVQDGTTGWLVPTGDEPQLAAALTAAIEDERERMARGRQAREAVVKRFSWSRVTREIAELIDVVLAVPALSES
jgi:glycosyltransferase involved in cell wall biosynthesis